MAFVAQLYKIGINTRISHNWPNFLRSFCIEASNDNKDNDNDNNKGSNKEDKEDTTNKK